MATPDQKYHQAAITYLIYGLIYMAGALYLASVGAGLRGGAVWFIVGALMALLFPLLIWKGFKWFTRVLAVFLGIRMIGLLRIILDPATEDVPMPWGGTSPVRLGAIAFFVVAGITCLMLIRAGWNVSLVRKERLEIDRR